MRLEIFASSDCGAYREHNEDGLLLNGHFVRDAAVSYTIDLDNEAHHLFVADGMGGHEFGEIASSRALEVLAEKLRLLNPTNPQPKAWLRKTVIEVHKHLLSLQGEFGNLGTTLCGVVFLPPATAVMVNVGDSRLYRLRGKKLQQISHDHTLRAMFHNPLIPGNLLASVLGGGGTNGIKIQTSDISRKIFPGDTLLLCSDGLSEYVDDEEIANVLYGNSDVPHLDLIRLAAEHESLDNVSVIVARVY